MFFFNHFRLVVTFRDNLDDDFEKNCKICKANSLSTSNS